jgi:LPXTG-motif cell wall-anchored protein
VYDPQQHRTHNGGSNAGEGLLYSSLPQRHPLAHPQLHKLKGKNVKMKRKITRVLAALFAMVMLVSCMSLSAFADGEDPVWIDKQNTTTNGHTYELFQIMTGEVDGEKVSNAFWGANAASGYTVGDAVDNSILNILQNLNTTSTPDSTRLATILNYVNLDSTPYNAIANTYVKYAVADGEELDTSKAEPALKQPDKSGSNTGSDNTYYSFVVPDGYYLVRDKAGTLDGSSDNYTLYLVKAANGTMALSPKGSSPTADKVMTATADDITSTGSASDLKGIGDTVYYTLSGTVTDIISSYNSYYYEFVDTLTPGLTLDADSVKVYVKATPAAGGAAVTQEVTDYFWRNASTYSETAGTTLKVAISDLLKLANLASQESTGDDDPGWTAITIDNSTVVYVTYSAVLNPNAVPSNQTGTGNINSVDVIYSNDPNHSGTGRDKTEPDKPKPEDPEPTTPNPTGKSTDDTVTVYTVGFTFEKQNSKNEPLNGAEFTLTYVPGENEEVKNSLVVSSATLTMTPFAGEKVYGYANDTDPEMTEYSAADIGVTNDDGTAKISAKNLYTAAENGQLLYWQLKNGSGSTESTDGTASSVTYTVQNPLSSGIGDDSKDKYTSLTTVYTKGANGDDTTKSVKTTDEESGAVSYSVSGSVDNTGLVSFTGLKTGTYVLSETVAPKGYQKISDITVTIGYTTDKGVTVSAKTADGTDKTGLFAYNPSDGTFHVTIEDSTAQALPSTGGIGTTIFYVVGSALAIGAIVLLITKKRMNNEVG